MASDKAVLEAIQGLEERLDRHSTKVLEAVSRNATAVAETRRAIGALDEKLDGVQEAIYFMAHCSLTDMEAEQVRSMLPNPPKRLASFEV